MSADMQPASFFVPEESDLLKKKHLAISNAMDGFALLDAEGRYFYLNDVHISMFGYDREDELIGKTWQHIYGPAEIERIQKDLFPLLMTNGKWSGETIGKTRDGRPVYQEISLTALPDGGMICICRDISQRKKDHELLNLQEQILKTTNSIVIVTNKKKQIEWVNDSFTRITGYTAEEAIGKNPGKLLQGKDTDPETVAFMWQELAKGNSFTCEVMNYTKAGKPYWVEIKCQPLLNEYGEAERYFAIEVDITERKETERKLRENGLRLQYAMDGARGAMWDWDIQNNTVYYSPQWKKMLGYEENEISNAFHEYTNRVHPEDLQKGMSLINEYLEGKRDAYKTYTRIKHKDGHYLYWLDQGIISERNKKGEPIRMVGAAIDLTELTETQQKLKESEARWNFALEGSGAGIWDWDLQNDSVFYSDKALEMVAYDVKPGKSPLEIFRGIVHPDDLDGVTHCVQQMIEGEDKKVHEYRAKSNGAGYIWIEDNAMVINRNRNGIPKRIIGSFRDITERKKTESELIRSKELAESLVKKERRFLANISHELRTPLHAVIGLSEQLEQSPLDQQQREFVAIINESARHLLELISDVLDLSKIAEGKIQLEQASFSYSKVLHDSIQLIEQNAREKGLRLKMDDCDFENEHFVKGDPLRLKQIFLNVLSNAVKFTEHGIIEIGYRVHSDNAFKKHMEIRISDTGIGMDDKMIARLFEDFVQGDESFARRYGGSGLGLSITRKLVEMMHGQLHISSKKSVGTSVRIDIPFEVTGRVATPVEPTIVIDNNWKNLRVLMAEDSNFIRLVAKIILNKHGIKPDEAVNGKDVIERLRSGKQYDMILMDIQMPEMDGIEATHCIRRELKLDIPIIAVTANAVKEELESYIIDGMNDYITKPFEEKGLINKIAKWAPKQDNDPAGTRSPQ